MRTQRPLWLTLAALGLAALAPAVTLADAQKYLPKDTEVVVSINLKQLLDSKLAKDNKQSFNQLKQLIETTMNNNDDLAKAQKALDFDLFRDLSGVTIAANGMKDPENVIMVFEGKFNEAKINKAGKDYARQNPEGLKSLTVNDRPAYEITQPGKDETFFLAVANKNTLLLTKTKAGLSKALEQDQAEAGAEMKALLKNVSPKSVLSFIATAKAIEKAMENAPDGQAKAAKDFLPKIKGMTASVQTEADITFDMGVVAKTAKFAGELADQANAGKAIAVFAANKAAQDNEQLAPLADIARSLRVSTQGSTVTVTGRVEGATVSSILRQIGNFVP